MTLCDLEKEWIDLNSSFWEVLATERELMFFVLSLIIIIAAFNIVTSLFILVQNKNREIAVLKTIGSSDSSILRIFLLVGTFIGFSGTIIGSILGVLFTINMVNACKKFVSTFAKKYHKCRQKNHYYDQAKQTGKSKI